MPGAIAHVRATAAAMRNQVKVVPPTDAAVVPSAAAPALVSPAATVAAHNPVDCETGGIVGGYEVELEVGGVAEVSLEGSELWRVDIGLEGGIKL